MNRAVAGIICIHRRGRSDRFQLHACNAAVTDGRPIALQAIHNHRLSCWNSAVLVSAARSVRALMVLINGQRVACNSCRRVSISAASDDPLSSTATIETQPQKRINFTLGTCHRIMWNVNKHQPHGLWRSAACCNMPVIFTPTFYNLYSPQRQNRNNTR